MLGRMKVMFPILGMGNNGEGRVMALLLFLNGLADYLQNGYSFVIKNLQWHFMYLRNSKRHLPYCGLIMHCHQMLDLPLL